MKRKYILFLICSFFLGGASAQTLNRHAPYLQKVTTNKPNPYFRNMPNLNRPMVTTATGTVSCCLKTGETGRSREVSPETAVKRRVAGGQLYLGQAYNDTYRFEDAVNCFEEYIADLSKRKRSTEEAEALLEKSKADLRMLKGVEDVCIIDSFVVDKANFLSAYKISEESGKLFTFNEFFQTEGDHPGTVYETEIGNKNLL